MKSTEQFVLWGVIFLLFTLWILRVLFLSSPPSDHPVSFPSNTGLRILIFLTPFLLVTHFINKKRLIDAFALIPGTRIGWIMTAIYSLGLTLWELSQKAIILSDNPWIYINFPFAPIIEELVFRGYIFTQLSRFAGKIETILITSVLFTLIHFPGWIFVSELRGEAFLTITGQIFLFSVFLGIIRLYAKSVVPTIIVHLINNLLVIIT